MANIRRIPPEPAQSTVPGGRTRSSSLIDLAAYPRVAQRQALNARLLSGICGHDAAPRPAFTEQDVAMLAQIAGERFGGEQVLLRRQALTALAQVRTLPAIEALAAIALSPLEDPSARSRALASIISSSSLLGRSLAQVLSADRSMPLAARTRKALGTGAPAPRKKKPRVPAKDRK